RAVPPFGASNNFPRSVARRIGADPKRAIWEVVGGQGPQHLANEFAHAIARGEMDLALMTGSEAISTVRHLQSKGETREWKGGMEGRVGGRGVGPGGGVPGGRVGGGGGTPTSVYALCENARRQGGGKARASYGLEMGRLFAPFTQVANGNPHAM